MLTLRKRRILFWISVFIFLAAVPVVLFYSLGYRLDSKFSLKRTGGIYISSPLSGSEIFLDENLIKRTNLLQQGVFVQNLAPGSYNVVVALENYVAWSKDLRVESQFVSEARALLVPKEPNGQVLLKGSFNKIRASALDPVLLLSEERKNKKSVIWYLPNSNEFLSTSPSGVSLEYDESLEVVSWKNGGVLLNLDERMIEVDFNFDDNLFTARRIPQSQIPESSPSKNERLDSRGAAKIYLDPERRELRASWLRDAPLPYYFSSKDQFILGAEDLRNFEFFPSRRDVVITAYQNGIFAVELDGRGQRNVQALYKGKNPDFAVLPGAVRNLFVLDEGVLIRVSIFAAE